MIAIVLIALLLLLLFPLLLFPGPYTTAFPRAFNSERWKAADTSGDARCGMIADVEYRIGVVGKTRAELVALLGEPENERDDAAFSSWLLCPSFMDIFILEVRWQNGRVAEAWVRDT